MVQRALYAGIASIAELAALVAPFVELAGLSAAAGKTEPGV